MASKINPKVNLLATTDQQTVNLKDMDMSEIRQNMLSVDDIFNLMDLYYNRKYIMYAHSKNSFDKFIEDDIKNVLTKNDNTFFEKITKDKDIKYKFIFDNIAIRPPIKSDGQYMFPSDAREKNLTYSSKIIAKVTQIQEISDIYTREIISRKVIGTPEENVPIATIPILVRSKYCSLNLKKDYDVHECEYDPGCYFIINGNEKVVISQERMCDNKPLVFIKKDSNAHNYIVQVNSKSPSSNQLMQVMTINLKNNGGILLRVPILSEFPVLLLFRALGVESDREIIDHIVYDKNDSDMMDAIVKALRLSTDEKGLAIKTQYDAINYLSGKIRVLRKYSETDKDIRQKQKRLHLEYLLDKNFLPHITGGRKGKLLYVGYMINRLLNCALGRTQPDDRDSYLNKRIDLVGNLLDELFRQFFRKMLNECNKYFRKRNIDDDTPINIINQIRPNTIEQGLKAALLTGAWGKKKGVAQVLHRLTYLQAIEFLRQINAPSSDASSSKLTHPRHLHATQNGNLCCIVGDTEVLMDDGITRKKVKDILPNDIVMSVNPDSLKNEISHIYGFFRKPAQDILEITTMSGRTIKCTLDHPFLIYNSNGNRWKRADELQMHDMVIIKPSHTAHILPNDQLITTNLRQLYHNNGYVPRHKNILDRKITQSQLEITAYMLGLQLCCNILIIDGNSYNCIQVGTLEDTNELFSDIIKLNFGAPYIYSDENSNSAYIVDKSGELLDYLLYMKVINLGKSTSEKGYPLPQWLHCTNLNVKRHYLFGTVCRTNNHLIIDTRKENYGIFLNPMVFITNNELQDETIHYLLELSKILLELDIQNNISIQLNQQNIQISINFVQTLDNYNKYMTCMGYHSNTKYHTYTLTIFEYVRYITYMQQNYHTRNSILNYDTFLESYKLDNDKILNLIVNIEQVGCEDVYDFTTISSNHSFIANDFIVHNCVETPEHAKVGLTKHLSLIGSITVPTVSQIQIINNILSEKITLLGDIHPSQLIKYSKVFLNGNWIGVCDKIYQLYVTLKQMKYNGTIEATTSITYDDDSNELRVYCDGGRLYRPVICVKNNEVLLTKKHIQMISPNKTKSEVMITSWEEFMQRNPGIIEYIDSDEQASSLISPNIETVTNMKIKEELSKKKAATTKEIDKTNRYGDMMFVRYSHCELHPSLLLGLIATNIPFLNHNQGPRNIFQYAQGRQAMCIYISNYRYRLDTSFILYHPHKPLVNTRTSKYMYNDILSPGENAVVAIGCYTGYNQEDSIVFNKSAIERGLFRSTSYNKYLSILQKNQSTSQDDIFMKPDPTKVSGMKHGSYDKLNEKGYVPEETTVVNGDFLIGKVTPIQPTANSNKLFKDNSVAYKQHVPGVVDKVYSDIYNVEGYEMKNMRIRSERIPTIGDKYCMRESAEALTNVGWIKIKDLTMSHKVATLINDEYLEYVHPIDIYKFRYNGDMYKLETPELYIDVTMDHELYVRPNKYNKYISIPARNVVGKSVQYKKWLVNKYQDIDYFHFRNRDISMDAWLKFIGIIYAIGQVNTQNELVISAHNPRIANIIRHIIIELNLPNLTYSDGEIIISDEYLSGYVFTLDIVNKILPNWVWQLSQRQTRILLDHIILYDECYNSNVIYYHTSLELFANDIMKLAIHSEYASDMHNIGENMICISINKVDSQYFEPRVNSVTDHPSQYETIYKYEGMVYCLEVPSHTFVMRDHGKTVLINQCSKHGQKGTIGIILPQSDMPFTEKGITPDLIINPNAIPSRMTIGQLLECLIGKVGAIRGHECDGTGFTHVNIDEIKDELEKLGYERNGSEYMFNGMTGQKLKSMIFIGPTYYQRLKHLVKDKMHSRARGPRTLLLHQPSEGRARGGGMRIGEMERDALIAHGIAKYIKEKLMDTSDIYTTYVCDQCGLFAQRIKKQGNKIYSTDNDVYECPSCRNKTNISKIVIPYAFKLLVQELMSMCIAPRIHTINNKYTN